MTDDELTLLISLITIGVLYLGHLVHEWKISDLEDRVKRLERKDEQL